MCYTEQTPVYFLKYSVVIKELHTMHNYSTRVHSKGNLDVKFCRTEVE